VRSQSKPRRDRQNRDENNRADRHFAAVSGRWQSATTVSVFGDQAGRPPPVGRPRRKSRPKAAPPTEETTPGSVNPRSAFEIMSRNCSFFRRPQLPQEIARIFSRRCK
jgi:hypothetical protein